MKESPIDGEDGLDLAQFKLSHERKGPTVDITVGQHHYPPALPLPLSQQEGDLDVFTTLRLVSWFVFVLIQSEHCMMQRMHFGCQLGISTV